MNRIATLRELRRELLTTCTPTPELAAAVGRHAQDDAFVRHFYTFVAHATYLRAALLLTRIAHHLSGEQRVAVLALGAGAAHSGGAYRLAADLISALDIAANRAGAEIPLMVRILKLDHRIRTALSGAAA
ncbi:hypothetical protein C1Y40_04592 [Mycobacterium talmoniae]|uniref:Uncharacterized protein n=1 Tax=Mycobacterium talmoniae TaxID=1858794 RepID=A0A2S8BF63_9MYCO|nr:hypothetical protein [Mycobacterium eburneum]PQM45268.1 hypothetical protein C1Y40_04592 [Mycobacterium talmoniae]TDH47218.1 hypothetical protein E2F47_26680 [Mycobacterium eburneum]